MMFQRVKSLALAAAFVCGTAASGMAQADVLSPSQLVYGLGSWDISSDGRDAFSAAGIAISTPAGYTGSFDGVDTINIPFSSLVPNLGNGVAQRSSTGPTFDLNRSVSKNGTTTLSRTAAVSDLVLNFGNSSITAHLSGINQLTGFTTDYGVVTLFSLSNLTGNTGGPSFSGQMTMTTAATDALFDIFGLPGVTPVKTLFQTTSWGTFTVTSAVPEPGSWALMLVGMASLGLMAARRRLKA